MTEKTFATGTYLEIGSDSSVEPTGDTFNKIGKIQSLSAFGAERNIIETKLLGEDAKRKYAGSIDSGEIEIKFIRMTDDSGQNALKAAVNTQNRYNFKIVYPDTESNNFVGTVSSFKAEPGDGDDIYTHTSTIAVSGVLLPQ